MGSVPASHTNTNGVQLREVMAGKQGSSGHPAGLLATRRRRQDGGKAGPEQARKQAVQSSAAGHLQGGVDGLPNEAADLGPHAVLLQQHAHRHRALPGQALEKGEVQVVAAVGVHGEQVRLRARRRRAAGSGHGARGAKNARSAYGHPCSTPDPAARTGGRRVTPRASPPVCSKLGDHMMRTARLGWR